MVGKGAPLFRVKSPNTKETCRLAALSLFHCAVVALREVAVFAKAPVLRVATVHKISAHGRPRSL
jgi:hypothetical protein